MADNPIIGSQSVVFWAEAFFYFLRGLRHWRRMTIPNTQCLANSFAVLSLMFRLLDCIREPLPDVPSVYFVLPSEENVRVLCQDFAAGLYESYYLNFISAINRPRLEDLSSSAVASGCVAQVQKVNVHYALLLCISNMIHAVLNLKLMVTILYCTYS